MNINCVNYGGRLTRDPELRFTGNGKAVCEFSVASNRSYGDKEDVCFLNCIAWEKKAELVSKHFKKGSAILLEGRLIFEEWQNGQGERRTTNKLFVEHVHFVDRKEQ